MEQDNRSPDLFNEMDFDAMGKEYIRTIASWAMVSVVVAVGGYILTILDLFRTKPAEYSNVEGFGSGFTQMVGSSTTFFTFLSIAIGLLINYFLFRFATQAKAGLDGHDQSKLNDSFRNLKSYFMACSIILIVIFVFFLLFFVVAGARLGA